MRYLGIDYGLKKAGLSLSEGQIAAPFKVLEISGLKDAVFKVGKVIKDEEIERVVVGVPESGQAEKITSVFVKELKKELLGKIEVIETEETLSSTDAKQFMVELGLGKKKRREEDAYSAVLILQRFLNSLS